ncbi:MAG: hypothetical protein IT299_03910 [Dehalococcoidia bacterium]|nr:hypothetical protein [Dehalococcoidia bacterium]
MEVEIAEQRLFLLQERLAADELQQRAMDRRMNAISSGIGSLLQRPRPEDVQLLGSERRLEPFWHVAGRARYVYDRRREYTVPASASEVQEVRIGGSSALVTDGPRGRQFALSLIEHCVEEIANELFLSATTGDAVPDAALVVTGPRDEIADPNDLHGNDAIVVPPDQRSSFVVRTLLTGIMKAVQADSVDEERMLVDHIDLYYRPVRAFEFYWKPRDRRGVVEVDAITGQVTVGRSLSSSISRVLTRDNIFDIGADTAGLLIPGGSIAVKVAKLAIDQASKPPH